jgi:hypothetical protein
VRASARIWVTLTRVAEAKQAHLLRLTYETTFRITATTVGRYENSVKNSKYSANGNLRGRIYGGKSKVRNLSILSKAPLFFSVLVSQLGCYLAANLYWKEGTEKVLGSCPIDLPHFP